MAESPSIDMKLVRQVPFQKDKNALDLLSVGRAPDSTLAYVGGNNGKIFELDLAASEPALTSWDAHVSFVSSLIVTAGYVISAGSDHQLAWWDRSTWKCLRRAEHSKWIRSIAISPDGRTLASACDDMVCRLWETETGKPIREFKGHASLTPYNLISKLYSCSFSRDGIHLATADQAGRALVWEAASGKQVGDIRAPLFYTHDTNGHTYGGIRTVIFSPDGKWLALGGNLAGDTSNIGGSKSMIQIYDWRKGELVHDFRVGGNFFYERIHFLRDPKVLLGAAGAGSEHKLVLFDLEKGAMMKEVKSPIHVFDLCGSGTSDEVCTVGPLTDQRHAGRGHLVLWKITGA